MRPREQSYHLTTLEKYKIVHSNKIKRDEKSIKESYKILRDYVTANMVKKELTTNAPTHYLSVKPPKYEGFKKSYSTKEKPIKFHEKAAVGKIDAGEINACQKAVDFQTLMAMFDNKEEIAETDIEKLLNIDLEKLGSLKDKVNRLIDYVNSCDDPKKDEVINALKEYIEKLKNSEDDIENVLVNVTFIDKIIYGPEETKIIFK